MGDRDVYTRGGRWWGVIPREEGEGIRRSLGLKASAPRTEAVARWLDIAKVQCQADTTAHTPRLGVAVDAYMKRRADKSEATREIDETKAGHFLRAWGELLPLHNINADRVLSYIEQREKEDAHPRTIHRELVVLRGVLKLAYHRGTFTTPLERVFPLDFSPKYIPRTRWLTEDDARRLLEELPEDRRGWVAFALATGARASEIEKATLVDIGRDEVKIRGTKTRRSADHVPITSLQRPWLAIAKEYASKSGPAFGTWTNYRRGLLHACSRLSTCLSCRAKGYGVPDPNCLSCRRMAAFPPVSANDLRRTLGFWLRNAGVAPHLIGKVLRHVDSRMAELVYATGDKEELRQSIEAQLSVRRFVRRGGEQKALQRTPKTGTPRKTA